LESTFKTKGSSQRYQYKKTATKGAPIIFQEQKSRRLEVDEEDVRRPGNRLQEEKTGCNDWKRLGKEGGGEERWACKASFRVQEERGRDLRRPIF